MSQYYNPKRTKNLYSTDLSEFRLGRSRIDNFINCPRCFYLDRKLGVAQPPGYPFSLNSAVDRDFKINAKEEISYATSLIKQAYKDIN